MIQEHDCRNCEGVDPATCLFNPSRSHENALRTVAELRRQVHGLVAHLDTTARPAPDHVNPPDHRMPGPVWHPAPGWTARVIDNDGMPDIIHLTTPDALYPNDMSAVRVAAVRRIAMAWLAACDVADERMQGVVVLGGRDKHEPAGCGGACDG